MFWFVLVSVFSGNFIIRIMRKRIKGGKWRLRTNWINAYWLWSANDNIENKTLSSTSCFNQFISDANIWSDKETDYDFVIFRNAKRRLVWITKVKNILNELCIADKNIQYANDETFPTASSQTAKPFYRSLDKLFPALHIQLFILFVGYFCLQIPKRIAVCAFSKISYPIES